MVDYSGYQSLPTGETVSMEPAVGGLEASSAIDPMLSAYFKKIGLDPAMIATLSPDDVKRMAYSARQDAYDTAMQADLQRSGKLQRIGTSYAEANPQDYYNTFGTIPLLSLGKSRFGIDEKTGTWDTAQGAEGLKYLTPDANATYTLYSPRSGQTLGTGTGAEGLLALTQMAQNQTANKDRKADWQLMQTPAGGGTPEIIGSNLYNTNLSGFGKIVAGALPIATAFIPGLNALGAIAAGAGAGGLSAAMKEQNILKGALLGGATAGVMNAPVLPGGGSLAQSIGTAINKVPILGDVTQALGKVVPGATGKTFTDATGAIVVPATRSIAPALANAVAQGGAQGVLNTLTQGPEPRRPDYGDKVEEPQNTDNDIVVTAGRNTALPGNLAASVISQFAPSLNAPTTQTTPTTETKQGPDTLDKVIGGLKIAGLLSAFIPGGSGSSNAAGAFLPGSGSANPLYSAKLPTPGVNGAFQVGGMGANSGALPVPAGGDYTRFGMGNAPVSVAPADIPQYGGVNPAGFNPDTMEWLGPQPVKKAMGGYAVGGPGTGRSDEIPAMLSDGEYVMDAETVAMLGDGSNKAGAKALDKFRANIRKHKGRKLAQGKFSVKAKQPEAYLSGGR